MNRASFVPLVLAVLALGLGGCATTRTVAGEPSPKEEGAAPETQPTEPASEGKVSETAPPPAAAQTAPPPAQPGFIPSGKPQIIARVERVQFPAWVERGGVKAGVKAGWAIYTSDRLTTGAEGRIELGVAGEGRLNIGGDANVEITEAYEFTGGAVEPSLLTVHRGAVMWNSPTVRAGNPGTLLQLGDGISASVLGGEIYAQVNSEETLMVLVDGAVQVAGPKLNPGTMREAGTSLRVPRAGRASPVTPVPGDRIARWLSGPVIVAGRPSLSANGTWDVSLNSGYSLRQLETMACQIQRRGFPTEIYPVKEPGKLTWYRVVVRRFATKADAVNFIGTARALGSKEPWVLVPQS